MTELDTRRAHARNVQFLAKAGGFVFLSHAFLHLAGFAYHAVLARTLGVSEYGFFLVGLGIFQFFLLTGQLGFQWGLLRSVALALGAGNPQAVRPFLAVTGAISGALTILLAAFWGAFSAPLAEWLGSPRYEPVFRALTWALPFAVAVSLATAALQALTHIRAAAFVQKLAEPFLRLAVLAIFLAGFRADAVSAGAAFSVSAVLAFTVAAGALRGRTPPTKENFLEACRKAPFSPLLVFSGYLLMTGLANYCLQWLDTILVGTYASQSAAGLYGAALRWAAVGGATLLAISYVLGPQVYQLYGRHDTGEVRRLLQTATRWLIIVNFPIFYVLICHGEWLLSLFGGGFSAAQSLLVVLAAGTLFNTATGPVGELLYMAGRSRTIFLLSAVTGLSAICLNVLLIPRWGAIGAAWANTSCVIFSNAMNVWLGWRHTGIHPYSRAVLKPLLLSNGLGLLTLALFRFAAPLGALSAALLSAIIWGVLYPATLAGAGLTETDKVVWRAVRDRITHSSNESA